MPTWVDFRQLRQQLKFEDLFRHYGVEIKARGKQHHGFCPLPNHKGKRNSQSFSANLERGIFQCFGCGAKGNALDFAALMSNVDPRDGTALQRIALELQSRFCTVNLPAPKPKEAGSDEELAEESSSPVINEPLDFELKGLVQSHPYLLKRGFLPDTISHFGLGFCARGMLKDRIAIPLWDHAEKLVGYAGRVVDDSTIGESNPRYRFPSKRERDGKVFEFRKSLFLYNGFRIKSPLDELIVTESFTAVWWLFQNGFSNVVATMGADCSDRQAELILSYLKPQGRAWILSDGDAAGDRLAESVLAKVSPHRFIRWLKLQSGTQPTDLSAEELGHRFGLSSRGSL